MDPANSEVDRREKRRLERAMLEIEQMEMDDTGATKGRASQAHDQGMSDSMDLRADVGSAIIKGSRTLGSASGY